MIPKDAKIIIGIDPGKHTGFAVWDKSEKKLLSVETLLIHQAMKKVLNLHLEHGNSLFVRFEDANLRLWYADKGRAQLQGAGSIKRDGVVWKDFLTDHKINFEAVAPARGMTKYSDAKFKMITGWKGRTNEHGRDAAILVIFQ